MNLDYTALRFYLELALVVIAGGQSAFLWFDRRTRAPITLLEKHQKGVDQRFINSDKRVASHAERLKATEKAQEEARQSIEALRSLAAESKAAVERIGSELRSVPNHDDLAQIYDAINDLRPLVGTVEALQKTLSLINEHLLNRP